MTRFLTTAALILAMSTAAHAGGPVIIEEAYTPEAPATKRKVPAWVFLALGAVVVAAIAGGGNDVCNDQEPAPEPGACN